MADTEKVRLIDRMSMNRPGTILFEEATNLFCVIVDRAAWAKKLQAKYPNVYKYFSKQNDLAPVYAFGDMIDIQLVDLCMGTPIPRKKGYKLWAVRANSCQVIFNLSSALSGFIIGVVFGDYMLSEYEKEVYASVSREIAVFNEYRDLSNGEIIPQLIKPEIARLEETYRSLKIPVNVK